MRKVSLKKIDLLIFLIFLSVFIWLTYYGQHLTGFPTGTDTYAHLFRIKFVLDNFPNINWNPLWDGGTLFWLWSHPPFPSVFQATLVKVFSISPEVVLTLVAASSYFLMLLGIYYFVFSGWGRWPAILAVFLILSNPGSFGWWSGGNYSRIFALGFWGLSLGLSALYLRKKEKGNLLLGSIIIFSTIAHGSHLLIGGLTFFSVSLLIVFWGRRERLLHWFKLVLFPLVLSSYWYIPLIFMANPSSRFFGGGLVGPAEWRNFIYPLHLAEHFALLPILPAVFIVGLIFTLFFKKKSKRKILVPILILNILSFGYLTMGYIPGYPRNGYIDGLPPISAFPAFAIFLPILTAGIWGETKLGKSKKVIFSFLIFLALVGVFWNKNFLIRARRDVARQSMVQTWYQKMIDIDPQETNFRLGTDSAFVADWFNYNYQIPQTRDYFNQGQIYPDWIAYLERAVWYWNDNYNETNFLLDWYAVKNFFVGEPHYNVRKFLDKEEYYLNIAEQFSDKPGLREKANEIFQFEYRKTSPIFVAVNTPTILVVGNDASYDAFIRTIAQTNLNSQELIPVKGGDSLDSFTNEQLRQFSALFLYGSGLSEKEGKLLGEYLKDGGVVLIESGSTFEDELPEFFPVQKLEHNSVKGKWGASWFGPGDVDISSFSPLEYKGDSWNLFEAKNEDLKDWASPLMLRKNKVWIAQGKFGKGQVVWSGINLPYHITTTRNPKEAEFFKELLYQYLRLGNGEVLGTGQFVNNQKRSISIPMGTKGVLLKESYFKNWGAYALSNGKREKLPILRAGLDFMYAQPPIDADTVFFEYKTSLIEKFSWFVSAVSFLIFVFWSSSKRARGQTARFVEISKIKIKDWWADELSGF